ncbi:UDP-N-acetylglucosamine 2-epimerase (non-hydrolyzing) [Alphaproteobacteria bacterium]|nr:UDP-N-acetylglucosamine 2-epimerase (non-hydrolyzing) [Alphaproteobacteria bacterium]MDA8624000.1 UDP-N-acetylglucosamine 2-epimerase (non-hydrolyzing) [Alphaproteobacteria bacterium]MDA8642670.1 UDP-N-acetylglucosamine 2-epimerase (non-hydrolyzing) [Alphaproteobacteria bacterium]MDA8726224.1 UDP-N-acetylglucosamine 2-epimerase (non-hydrolyzing) [Alphaproteobacteria bacterium]MDA8780009.1 UDP-N-acetylglucosamine 2-epimerase (non-hydrolyzing) [Alphaproteobacteria bacterium]
MKKILIVFGTRPEAIKMAPLVKAMQAESKAFDTQVCVTAQHRDMLDQVLNLFNITPEHDLNLMQPGQSLTALSNRVLTGIEQVLSAVKPDLVFVHGDTTTSSMTALAAFYQQIDVAHIEAGLRTHNLYAPWPEEANRQITGRLTKWHFAPTELARQNLRAENTPDAQICVTGNTVIDALYWVRNQIGEDTARDADLRAGIAESGFDFSPERRVILITAHRRENFGAGFENICKSLATLAENNLDCDLVYPVHLNPNVQKPVHKLLGDKPNIHLIAPLDYEPFVWLMLKSHIVLTDSGGIQEEAPGLGKPVVVMRETTERPEAAEAGTVKLVGTNGSLIASQTQALLDDESAYAEMSRAHNPYGDGKACRRIIDFLLDQVND